MTLSHAQQHIPAGPPMMMRNQGPVVPQMQFQPAPQQQQHSWGGDFQSFVEGKGKGRETASPAPMMQYPSQPQSYAPMMGGMGIGMGMGMNTGFTPSYSSFTPRYTAQQPLSHTTYAPQSQEVGQVDPVHLDAEFERAEREHQEALARETATTVEDDKEIQEALGQQKRDGDNQPDFEA
jgi:hypothetical protein